MITFSEPLPGWEAFSIWDPALIALLVGAALVFSAWIWEREE